MWIKKLLVIVMIALGNSVTVHASECVNIDLDLERMKVLQLGELSNSEKDILIDTLDSTNLIEVLTCVENDFKVNARAAFHAIEKYKMNQAKQKRRLELQINEKNMLSSAFGLGSSEDDPQGLAFYSDVITMQKELNRLNEVEKQIIDKINAAIKR